MSVWRFVTRSRLACRRRESLAEEGDSSTTSDAAQPRRESTPLCFHDNIQTQETESPSLLMPRGSVLCREQDALTQHRKSGPTIHLAFDGLDFVHEAFQGAIAPGQGKRRQYSRLVLLEPFS